MNNLGASYPGSTSSNYGSKTTRAVLAYGVGGKTDKKGNSPFRAYYTTSGPPVASLHRYGVRAVATTKGFLLCTETRCITLLIASQKEGLTQHATQLYTDIDLSA
jgi:hypothetical protein